MVLMIIINTEFRLLSLFLCSQEVVVRDAAASCLAVFTGSSDGAAFVLASPAQVVPATVTLLGDSLSSEAARLAGLSPSKHYVYIVFTINKQINTCSAFSFSVI